MSGEAQGEGPVPLEEDRKAHARLPAYAPWGQRAWWMMGSAFSAGSCMQVGSSAGQGVGSRGRGELSIAPHANLGGFFPRRADLPFAPQGRSPRMLKTL